MSVEDTGKVDALGIDRDGGKVVLAIFDSLAWDHDGKHLQLLQDKLNAYIAFIESGEMVKEHPDAKGLEVQIKLMILYPITQEAQEFFQKVEDTLRTMLIAFIVEVDK